MKKRIFLLSAALMACTLGAIAQDVTILHMKDGTQRRYTNGVKGTTQMRFFEFAPEEQTKSIGHVTTSFYNDYSYQWPVTAVWHADKQYTVAVVWSDDIPENFGARRGLCFGTKPGLTIDNCDTLAYYFEASYLEELGIKGMIIGTMNLNTLTPFYYEPLQEELQPQRFTNDNRIPVNLQPGQTYYYRTFAQGYSLQNNEIKPVVFYGEEMSFRVPNVIMDSDYNTYPQFSEEAMAQFATHFPDSVTAPTRAQLEPLWDKWRQTAQGAAYDLTPYISTKTFDDGIGYRLDKIPDEFYDWLIHREVYIDIWNGLIGTVSASTPYLVTNVDTSWGVPNNTWICIDPENKSVNPEVIFHSEEVMPGVNYKLQLTFAPETRGDDYSNLPGTVETSYLPKYQPGGSISQRVTIFGSTEISGTEVTTLLSDAFKVSTTGLDLDIRSRVTGRNASTHTRTLRIAQLRLIPE